jgi:hypothetical protein
VAHIRNPARIGFVALGEHIDPAPGIDDGLNVDIAVIVVVALALKLRRQPTGLSCGPAMSNETAGRRARASDSASGRNSSPLP